MANGHIIKPRHYIALFKTKQTKNFKKPTMTVMSVHRTYQNGLIQLKPTKWFLFLKKRAKHT